jgi:hypothetical protein
VQTGRGGDRRSEEARSTATLADVAREANVPERTARSRVRLAEDLERATRTWGAWWTGRGL